MLLREGMGLSENTWRIIIAGNLLFFLLFYKRYLVLKFGMFVYLPIMYAAHVFLTSCVEGLLMCEDPRRKREYEKYLRKERKYFRREKPGRRRERGSSAA